MNGYDYEDEREAISPFQNIIEKLVEKEITKRLSDRIKQAERDSEYHKNQMWKAKLELSKIRQTLSGVEKETAKQIKEAAKIAQREYWFDCAIGDYVYLIDYKYHRKKCDRCNGLRKLKVLIDEVEVDAECPKCGTYEKARSLEYREPYIAGGKVKRLQIEMTETHKWIKLWLDRDEDYKYELEYHKVFRTKEEAETALKEILDNREDQGA